MPISSVWLQLITTFKYRTPNGRSLPFDKLCDILKAKPIVQGKFYSPPYTIVDSDGNALTITVTTGKKKACNGEMKNDFVMKHKYKEQHEELKFRVAFRLSDIEPLAMFNGVKQWVVKLREDHLAYFYGDWLENDLTIEFLTRWMDWAEWMEEEQQRTKEEGGA
jgi:hypothetical protein